MGCVSGFAGVRDPGREGGGWQMVVEVEVEVEVDEMGWPCLLRLG